GSSSRKAGTAGWANFSTVSSHGQCITIQWLAAEQVDKFISLEQNIVLTLREYLVGSSAMRERLGLARLCRVVSASLLLSLAALSQSLQPEASQPPAEEEVGFLQSQGAHPRFEAASKISADATIALQRRAISSVPHFSGSFAFEGKTFPYTLVGSTPQAGGTTEIPTQMIVASVLLVGFVDQQREPIMLCPSTVLGGLHDSPNFRNS